MQERLTRFCARGVPPDSSTAWAKSRRWLPARKGLGSRDFAHPTALFAKPVTTLRDMLYKDGMDDPRFSNPHAWRNRKAPSLAEFDLLADSAFSRLPQKFRALCEGLIIRVEDFPEEKVLDDLGAESEFDLLGLFQGVGLPFQSESTPVQMPNMIWLYRRPILDYWAEHEETLGAII